MESQRDAWGTVTQWLWKRAIVAILQSTTILTKVLGIEGALVSPNDSPNDAGSICPRVPCDYHPL